MRRTKASTNGGCEAIKALSTRRDIYQPVGLKRESNVYSEVYCRVGVVS
jgi:hypothetical protein